MSRYATISTDGLVSNVIIWDGEAEFDPGEGISLVPLEDDSTVQVGDTISKKGRIIRAAESVESSPSEPNAVSVSQDTLDQVRAALSEATTVSGVVEAIAPLLDALGEGN